MTSFYVTIVKPAKKKPSHVGGLKDTEGAYFRGYLFSCLLSLGTRCSLHRPASAHLGLTLILYLHVIKAFGPIREGHGVESWWHFCLTLKDC